MYLARPWACCQDCVFRPAAEIGEKAASSPCTAEIPVKKIGQRWNLKSAAIHSVAPFQFASLSTPSLVGLATIPCTLHSYLPAVNLQEGNIAFSAAVSQINKPSYSGDTSSKVFCINSSAVSAESPSFGKRTAIQVQSLFCTCRWARAFDGVCLSNRRSPRDDLQTGPGPRPSRTVRLFYCTA